jgi:hypothetical protein
MDTDFGPPQRRDGELAIAGDGVRIRFEVASVLDGGSGSVELHYRLPLEAAILGRLPAAGCPVTLSQAFPALLRSWQGTTGS